MTGAELAAFLIAAALLALAAWLATGLDAHDWPLWPSVVGGVAMALAVIAGPRALAEGERGGGGS